jgi:hypothetical protein
LQDIEGFKRNGVIGREFTTTLHSHMMQLEKCERTDKMEPHTTQFCCSRLPYWEARASMGKNIVVLFDATSNEIATDETNILRLARGILNDGDKRFFRTIPGFGTQGAPICRFDGSTGGATLGL